MSESLTPPDWIPQDSLRQLHPEAIGDEIEIRRLLLRACSERLELRRGTNQQAVPERAWIERVGPVSLLLSLKDFDRSHRDQVFFNLCVDGVYYFFGSHQIRRDEDRLEVAIPSLIFRAERRDRPRRSARKSEATRVRVLLRDTLDVRGWRVDSSPGGAGIELDSPVFARAGERVVLDVPSSSNRAREYGEIRHLQGAAEPGRWRRLGICLTHAPRDAGLAFEKRVAIAPAKRARFNERTSPARRSEFVSYHNASGEVIRAIVDSVGTRNHEIVAVIPPAWGRTKESTAALSETILETFGRAGCSASVVRFDGIRRRGESQNDPGCVPPIRENLHYTFSQGVQDIQATLDFIDRTMPGPRRAFLVSLSIASVEARRAIAQDMGKRIAGWVSVVGAVDPQSMIRVVSGGVDYFAGAVKGLRFGAQYIQGLLLDVDQAARDAIESRIAFLDDARADMASIRVPLTWLSGMDDAWTQEARVRDMLTVGDCSNRKLIQLPIGHQLRSSREALETFELVASELSRMAIGTCVPSVQPSRRMLVAKRRAERSRLAKPQVDLREFWRDYLVGRDGRLGIELMSSTSSYRALMNQQIAGLGLRGGETVVDVGSGAGAFPVQLAGRNEIPPIRIVEVDFVREGLNRCRTRLSQAEAQRIYVSFVAANLDLGRTGCGIPLAAGSADAVLASLLVNYVSRPELLIKELARILVTGGRLVISGMREDADVSKICVAGVSELRSYATRVPWKASEGENIDGPLQEFISSGARILDLEEAGLFQFWDSGRLKRLIDNRYFRLESLETAYGDPPQAWVAIAIRTRESAI